MYSLYQHFIHHALKICRMKTGQQASMTKKRGERHSNFSVCGGGFRINLAEFRMALLYQNASNPSIAPSVSPAVLFSLNGLFYLLLFSKKHFLNRFMQDFVMLHDAAIFQLPVSNLRIYEKACLCKDRLSSLTLFLLWNIKALVTYVTYVMNRCVKLLEIVWSPNRIVPIYWLMAQTLLL